jgi:hypothetical protein
MQGPSDEASINGQVVGGTTATKKELIIECGDCKGFVEVGPHDTLADVRALLHEEFDDDLKDADDGDAKANANAHDAARDAFSFSVAGVLLSRNQERRKRAWD